MHFVQATVPHSYGYILVHKMTLSDTTLSAKLEIDAAAHSAQFQNAITATLNSTFYSRFVATLRK